MQHILAPVHGLTPLSPEHVTGNQRIISFGPMLDKEEAGWRDSLPICQYNYVSGLSAPNLSITTVPLRDWPQIEDIANSPSKVANEGTATQVDRILVLNGLGLDTLRIPCFFNLIRLDSVHGIIQTHQHNSTPFVMASTSFDYVIVGGGLAGLVLAARLSEDAGTDVLVIEAGEDQTSDPRVQIPGMWPTLIRTESAWEFKTVPQVCTYHHRGRPILILG